MLELGGCKFAGSFGRMIAADTRLGVVLKLRERDGNSHAVGKTRPFIAADKSGQ
jgi:hypothetical protein